MVDAIVATPIYDQHENSLLVSSNHLKNVTHMSLNGNTVMWPSSELWQQDQPLGACWIYIWNLRKRIIKLDQVQSQRFFMRNDCIVVLHVFACMFFACPDGGYFRIILDKKLFPAPKSADFKNSPSPTPCMTQTFPNSMHVPWFCNKGCHHSIIIVGKKKTCKEVYVSRSVRESNTSILCRNHFIRKWLVYSRTSKIVAMPQKSPSAWTSCTKQDCSTVSQVWVNNGDI